MHKLIILSGPSCVGKTPLFKAFQKLHPSTAARLRKLVLYNSRAPRPGEKEGIDYFFRPKKDILALKKKPGFIVMDVRGDLQALDVRALRKTLCSSSVIFEGNPFIGGKMLSLASLRAIPRTAVFLSPLSRKEVAVIKKVSGRAGLERFITRMMRKKLIVRAVRQGRELNAYALRDIGRRAKSAPGEIGEAWRYAFVIPNHDGEDSPNWTAPLAPVGEAGRSLAAFTDILKGRKPSFAEKWPRGLL